MPCRSSSGAPRIWGHGYRHVSIGFFFRASTSMGSYTSPSAATGSRVPIETICWIAPNKAGTVPP
ncbi:UNVERIFIED_CONTAM: hypothetical protein Sradi_7144000 [Sesamum radiatum]|uniref:Uncharacterized protein n=1 Tax=Sesamum radiatum TaxID=300843 RepID=A0AAW2IWP6_SESRA